MTIVALLCTMHSDKFSLSWSEFEKGASNAFRELLDEIEFVDVTLVSDDLKQIKAHKVILSACSSIFKKMLQQNPQQQPIIYLTGVAFKEMQSMVNFMYLGQTEVEQDDLNHFMEVAAKFDVKGLSQDKPSDEATFEHNFKEELPVVEEERKEADSLFNEDFEMDQDDINHFMEISAKIDMKGISPEKHAATILAGDLEEKCSTDNEWKPDAHSLESSVKASPVQSSDNLYSCEQCDYKSDRPYSIKIHKKARHDGIKFPCDQCEYKSTFANALSRHKKNQHTS